MSPRIPARADPNLNPYCAPVAGPGIVRVEPFLAKISARSLAGSVLLALKCWYHALSGIANSAPDSHSKVRLGVPSYQMLVAPRPFEMKTSSS